MHLQVRGVRRFGQEVSASFPYRQGPPFRVGDWYRVDSQWEMGNFTAVDSVELDKATIHETLAGLRKGFADVAAEDFTQTMEVLRHE